MCIRKIQIFLFRVETKQSFKMELLQKNKKDDL